MRRYLQRFGITTSLILILAGCAPSPTFLQPHSTVAATESNLYVTIFWMAVGVFALVELMLLFNIIRFRSRGTDTTEPVQKFGNWRLEFVWTVIPILLVLLLFVFTVQTINAVAAPSKQPTDINVTVIGHQWWWEFDYPDLGIKTANELHVPAGANIKLSIQSADVIHSFWVPQLSHKIDAVPGQTNNLWFRANTPGEYYGQCAEFCGQNHANMRIYVYVDTADQFASWRDNQQKTAYQPANDLEQKGHDVITKGLCKNCHTLGDNQALNPVGPNLTHLMSRHHFAGAMFELTPENLQKWLEGNQTMKPGNDMNATLTPDEVQAVMAFLLKSQ